MTEGWKPENLTIFGHRLRQLAMYFYILRIRFQGEVSYGKLAHGFNCKKADDIFYKSFAVGVRHFKETKEGRFFLFANSGTGSDQAGEIIVNG